MITTQPGSIMDGRIDHLLVELNSVASALQASIQYATKTDLREMEERIMAKASELAGMLAAITAQVKKSTAEVVAKIKALEDALANVDLPPEADAALTDLKAAVQAEDDVVPDPIVAGMAAKKK